MYPMLPSLLALLPAFIIFIITIVIWKPVEIRRFNTLSVLIVIILLLSILHIPYMWDVRKSWAIFHIIACYSSVTVFFFVGTERLYTKIDHGILYLSIASALVSLWFGGKEAANIAQYQDLVEKRFKIAQMDKIDTKAIENSFEKIQISILNAQNSISEESKVVDVLIKELTYYIDTQKKKIALLTQEKEKVLEDLQHLQALASLSEDQIQAIIRELKGDRTSYYLITGLITYILGVLSTGTYNLLTKRKENSEKAKRRIEAGSDQGKGLK